MTGPVVGGGGSAGIPRYRQFIVTSPGFNEQTVNLTVSEPLDMDRGLLIPADHGERLMRRFQAGPGVYGPMVRKLNENTLQMRGNFQINTGENTVLNVLEFPLRNRVYQEEATFTWTGGGGDDQESHTITPSGSYKEGSIVVLPVNPGPIGHPGSPRLPAPTSTSMTRSAVMGAGVSGCRATMTATDNTLSGIR